MDHSNASREMDFAILGNLRLIFCPSKASGINGSVEWCATQSGLQADNGAGNETVEEFDLTNFSGRLVVKRRNNSFAAAVQQEANHLVSLPPRLVSAIKGSMSPALMVASSKKESVRFVDDDMDMSFISAEEEDEDYRKNGEETWQSHSMLDRVLRSSIVGNEAEPTLKMGPGSPLHTLCASSTATLKELQICLAENPTAPFVTNIDGRTPLFLLTENQDLWYSNFSQDAHSFALELVNANPAAVAMTDCEDHWPCQSILSKWIDEQYADIDDKQGNILTNVLRNVGTAVTSSTAQARNAFSTMTMEPNSSSTVRRKTFTRAHVTPAFESALAMLSYSFTSQTTTQQLSQEQQLDLRQAVCHRVAVEIPRLLSTLFLLEPETVRHRVFGSPFIKRYLLEPATVGPWLVTMVRRKGLPCRRSVDYLVLLSHTEMDHFLADVPIDLDADQEEKDENIVVTAYRESKIEVLNAIGDMGALIPSLFVLEERELDRATSVSAIWHIMQHVLRRPFIIGIVMIDFVLHLTLMLSFRASVIDNELNLLSGVPTRVVSAITSFYVVRKISEGIALWAISKTVFQSYFLDLWNLFDTLSIILVIVADSVETAGFETPGFNSFVLALLWLKVLAFLKAVNLQMATFILSLMRIVLDIRFFMIVLIVFIMMFGDIMTIIFTTTFDKDGNKAFCNGDSDPQQDFCSGNSLNSYLRMYGVLIGDFELNDYREGGAVAIVFLTFTLVGVIILLNVLIAVVSDSYEKATAGAKSLFGKARIGFLAEHMALEQFLQPGSNPLKGIDQDLARDPKQCFSLISRVVRWLVLLGLLVTALFAEIFLVGQAVSALKFGASNIFLAFLMVGMSFILTVALWVVIYDLLSKMFAGRNCSIPIVMNIIRFIHWFMVKSIDYLRTVAFGDFGIDDEIEEVDDEKVTKEFLEKVIREVVAEAERKLTIRIHTAEDTGGKYK